MKHPQSAHRALLAELEERLARCREFRMAQVTLTADELAALITMARIALPAPVVKP